MKGSTNYWTGFLLVGIVFTSCETGIYEPMPQADFFIENDTVMAPAEVVFENSSELEGSYLWDFGDGNLSSDISPVHTYSKKGTYTVTLKVLGESGESQISKNLVVESAYEYVILNTSPFTLYNLKSFETKNDSVVNLIEHGTLLPNQKSVLIITKGDKIGVSFENGQGYRLTVIFPYDVEKGKVNFLEIKKYTMVYIEKIEDQDSSTKTKSTSTEMQLDEFFSILPF